MSRQAYLSPAAEADLVDIWIFIAVERRAPESADRFIVKIRRHCQVIALSPGVGRRRDELGSGIRSFAVGRYLILYREVTDGIEVARVVSGYRDLPSIVGE